MYQFSRDDLWRDRKLSELYPSWQEMNISLCVDKKLGLSRDLLRATRNEASWTASDRWTVR
jgi:hypothetical protein